MKKMAIALAAMAVIGMGVAMADDYWGCVADSVVTGADAAAAKANDYGVDSTTKNISVTAGAIGGAAAGLIHCD